jgi:hypothetical protein
VDDSAVSREWSTWGYTQGVAVATIIGTGVSNDAASRSGRSARGKLFFWLAIACAAIAIGGFMPTYWLQLAPRTFIGSPLLHIHGAVCTLWVIFLISQTWLVSENRLHSHRSWGLVGISLATAVVIIGFATAVAAMEAGLERGLGDTSRAFLITPLSAIFRFGLFTGAAIVLVTRPEWHKRFMIVGTIALIEAAGARVALYIALGSAPGMRPGLGPPPPAIMPVVVGLLLQLLVVIGMIYDWRTRGRVHPAWIVGLLVSVIMIVLKVPLSHTEAWLRFAHWTTTITG